MKKKLFRERRKAIEEKGMTFKVDEPTDEIIEELAKKQEKRINKALKEIDKPKRRTSKKKEA